MKRFVLLALVPLLLAQQPGINPATQIGPQIAPATVTGLYASVSGQKGLVLLSAGPGLTIDPVAFTISANGGGGIRVPQWQALNAAQGQTVFTVAAPYTAANVLVLLNGIPQTPNVGYLISGQTVTFPFGLQQGFQVAFVGF